MPFEIHSSGGAQEIKFVANPMDTINALSGLLVPADELVDSETISALRVRRAFPHYTHPNLANIYELGRPTAGVTTLATLQEVETWPEHLSEEISGYKANFVFVEGKLAKAASYIYPSQRGNWPSKGWKRRVITTGGYQDEADAKALENLQVDAMSGEAGMWVIQKAVDRPYDYDFIWNPHSRRGMARFMTNAVAEFSKS